MYPFTEAVQWYRCFASEQMKGLKMPDIQTKADTLIWKESHEYLRIEPWGKNGLRVRIDQGGANPKLNILEKPTATKASVRLNDNGGRISNGKITAEITTKGRIQFFRNSDNSLLLAEKCQPDCGVWDKPIRTMRSVGGDLYKAEVAFDACDDERIYGLGQHRNGRLDQKGCVIDLSQRNCEVAIPFLVSSKGYGFIWHNPAIGRVELGHYQTKWVAEATSQIDYVVMAGDSYAEIMRRYSEATGFAPILPKWASGFWQSRACYPTQETLLAVAHQYKKRKLPLDVIVIDCGHYPNMGDWCFDLNKWPDPKAMVEELEKMGVKLMVSVWPVVGETSNNFGEMYDKGYLLATARGVPGHLFFHDGLKPFQKCLYHYDPTNTAARKYLWQKIRRCYYRHGIKVWWLDAC